MIETSSAALLRAISSRLSNPPAGITPNWGPRAYLDIAPAKAARPMVVFTIMGGGETNERLAPDANYVVLVKCIADRVTDALEGAKYLQALLNDQGVQDGAANPLSGGNDWTITTSTNERTIHMTELIDGTPVYHHGFHFRLVMQSR